ncbi:MAG: hypothetical protein IPN50_00990 [Sphingomonadales bacterium]|jgi:hypothetical protein|nr:hypothetical protein [Sphingomonadales bacterium]MBL0021169.1 hypothetical protein [Sphingomonadales bacterium]
MRLLITEVTDMSAGSFCVAGWDIDSHVMIRPLPNGSNWTTATIAQYAVEPGILMEFSPTGRAHNGSFPHTTEDTEVNAANISVIDRSAQNWLGPNSPSRARTVQEAFGGNVESGSEYRGRLQSLYVGSGTRCRSLWGIEVPRENIEFISDSYKGGPERLKAVVDDGDHRYVFSVSSHSLKEAFGHGGLAAVEALLPASGQLHVRLGLARPFSDAPKKCNLMLNGVYG